MNKDKSGAIRIGLLGASFDTGNLGVSALAESSIRCILHRWPNTQVELLASGRYQKKYNLQAENRDIDIENLPIRFCKNIFMKNHYVVLFMMVFLARMIPLKMLRKYFETHNSYYARITKMDLIADITGGDSFSDIYGTRRFIQGALLKYLCLLFGIKFYFLPQTYGPFKRRWVRCVARFLLKRADMIYSRDQQGYVTIKTLFNKSSEIQKKVHIVPDVAFVLEPLAVTDRTTARLEQRKKADDIIVGLNINGLLYSGGYTRNNMFLLSVDYSALIKKIILQFLEIPDSVILLVPHVCPSKGYEVESDPIACHKVIQNLNCNDQSRIILPNADYDHRQIKHVISFCDFFIGSRMHSCIAAMSQGIPTVGLAYSNKFSGVFESVGQKKNIIDLRDSDEKKVIISLLEIYDCRDVIRDTLAQVVPTVKEQVLGIFDGK